MLKKSLYVLLVFIILIGILFSIGPTPEYEKVDGDISTLNIPIQEIDSYVAEKESLVEGLKPDNQARIIWADSTHQKTEYSVIYLHGFSASQKEGDPIHIDFAKRYGMNLFLSRLEDHGRLDSNTFIDLTPSNLLNSAKEAIAIGNIIGDKVIVMSCSTGSTLSAYLAAYNPSLVHSQIMYSPNIDIEDPLSNVLLYPWGYQLTKMSFGSEYLKIPQGPESKNYWNQAYHLNGLTALKYLIDQTMTMEVFSKINQPLFIGYYYKNEEEKDNVVCVSRMRDFYKEVSTEDSQKLMIPFPKAGRHVIASHLKSEDIDGVRAATFDFGDNVLGLTLAKELADPIH